MHQLLPVTHANAVPASSIALFPATQALLSDQHQQKILVVDDNPVVIKALSFKLKSKGYDVCTAQDGSDAVSCVRRERPDLIVLDINFPPDVGHGGGVPWDGFLILDWLRRLEEARTTPIIFITATDSQKNRERAMTAGAVAFFLKPFNHDELMAVIQHTVGDPPTRTGSSPAT